MKREWVFQTVPMRTPQKRSFKILQQIFLGIIKISVSFPRRRLILDQMNKVEGEA